MTDPTTLRALAHPLRLDLIELLGTIGPATAATCARHLGVSQASASFHLRQLEAYGFAERAPATGDRRERPWRVTDVEQSWSSTDSGAAAQALEQVFVEREAARILAWSTATNEPEEWRRASFLGGATVPMTPEELADVGAQLSEVLAPYVARLGDPAAAPDGARFVRVLLAGTPLPHLDPDPTSNEVRHDRDPDD